MVGQRREALTLDLLERGGQRHVAEPRVVAVRFAVGRAVDELGPGAVLGQAAAQPLDQHLATRERIPEGDRARDGCVVEEERERWAAGPAPVVGSARIDLVTDVPPGRLVERADPARLVRCQDRELDAGLGEHLETLAVGRRLREPHAFGIAAEPVAEVLDAPADLGDLVAPGAERHDRVVVDLRDRIAVAAARAPAQPVRFEDLRVHVRPLAFEPGEQRGADVEGDLLVGVDDVEDAVVRAHAPRRGVRRVALDRDAIVPVVPGVRRVLDLDGFEPGIFARGLVEMPVDGDEPRAGLRLRRRAQNSSRPERNSRRPPRGTTTRPDGST